jgi:nucleotide-binding universal stress UspA family protein
MFQKVLIAIDMSFIGDNVFAKGLSIAKLGSSQLMLLHILSAEEDNSPLPVPPDLNELYPVVGNDLTLQMWREQWEKFEREGLELLQARQNRALEAGVRAEVQQISGNAGKTICKVAKDWQADLIVIGRRGRSGLSEIILGSVSNYVLHHAPCSVLIVQH